MSFNKFFSAFLLFFIFLTINAQKIENEGIDVKQYFFELNVNDTTNMVEGIATISLKIKKEEKQFTLDLISLNESNKGRQVIKITNKNKPVSFEHINDKIIIQITYSVVKDSLQKYKIKYKGIPQDGLIISKNEFGERTFFGDNWPKRTRIWLTYNDEIDDKAKVDFVVKAPDYYQVVSNGVLVEELNIGKGLKLFHYSYKTLISTYLMVVTTYFTNLYLENKYGNERLKERMINERNKIIRFYKKQQSPVIDEDQNNYMKLLNANSYEKGGWFLHMLRIKIGENLFWESIITYYQKYKYNNALTDDFKNIVKQVTNKDLTLFFDQWLYNIGQPELDLQWKNMNDKVEISLSQLQRTKTIFKFPLDLQFHNKDGSNQINTIVRNKKEQIFSFPISSPVVDIVIDPNIKLLYQEK